MLLRYVSDTAPGWHGIKESTREIRAGLDAPRHGGNDKTYRRSRQANNPSNQGAENETINADIQYTDSAENRRRDIYA